MENNSFSNIEQELQKELINRDREGSQSGDSSAMMAAREQRMSVLLRTITAVKEENDYRQLIIMADFLDDEEADRVAAAITEARRYGLSLDPILDWVTARCGVNKAGHGKNRVTAAIEGLTHSTFTTVNQEQQKRNFFNRGTTEKGDS